jgi:hypothetical protein
MKVARCKDAGLQRIELYSPRGLRMREAIGMGLDQMAGARLCDAARFWKAGGFVP